MAAKFELKILSPSRQLASSQATAVTLPGTAGYMTILPDHAAMVAELDIGEVVVQTLGAGAERYFISGGYVEVDSNHVTILADIIERGHEINVNRAQAARKRATDRLGTLQADTDLDRANRSLRRAEMRVLVAQALAATARH